MLERYLLSTLASKFGHVFEDFDENTTAELSAWRGVLALRNLHLRRDALKHLGVPLAGGVVHDDFEDDEDFEGDDVEDDDVEGYLSSNQLDGAAFVSPDNDSDDDSFRSCASQIDEDDISQASLPGHNAGGQSNPTEDKPPGNISTKSQKSGNNNIPTIEISHGSIGSLELHIPWRLLRATKMAAAAAQKEQADTTSDVIEDESMRCSAVLSDVRILLAPSNNTRNRSKFDKGSMNQNQTMGSGGKHRSTAKKKRQMQDLERMRIERELAVQSLLEAELFRLIRGVANGEEGDGGTNSTSNDNAKVENTDTSAAKRDSSSNATTTTKKDGWLARWAKGLVSRILSSLQVTVENIHIRYEDEGYGWFEDTPFPQQQQRHRYRPAFAVGIRLGSFSIESANTADGGKSTSESDNTVQSRNKVAKVEKLSVYWDSCHPDLFVGYSTDEDDRDYYENRFEELDIMSSDDFEGGDGTLHHSYLIQPMSPSLQLMMVDSSENKTSIATEETNADSESISEQPTIDNSESAPSINATLLLPCCHVCFDRNTLEDAAYVRKLLSAYKVRMLSSKDQLIEQRISRQLSDLRPSLDIRPGNNPRLWWQYAIRTVRALQANRRYFEGKSEVKEERKWRRDGWLGLARLLRLRNEYTAQYRLLWRSSHDDPESKAKIHQELLALEDQLNEVEIAAFRVYVFRILSQSSSSSSTDLDLRASESIDVDELALAKLSATSLEYRETKLYQVVQSIDSELGELEVFDHSSKNAATAHNELNGKTEDGKENDAPMWAVSIECQDFTVQANDAYHAKDSLHNIPTLTERKQAVPIARLHCQYFLRFDKFGNGSWDALCAISSLTVTDLISPSAEGTSGGNALIGKNQSRSIGGKEDAGAEHPDGHTLSIAIHNVVPTNTCSQAQATTHCNVEISPLEVTYSTVSFEALSRLFSAVKTTEFNRDYGRVTQALSRWRSRQRERLKAVLARQKKFIVSIDIAAPVLLIPEDLQNTSAPTLVVDLGRLTFQSDSGSRPSGFDDRWLLGIESVRALCIQPKSGYEHAIIEPFSLTFSILTHIAKGETTGCSKVNIEALLPQLCFNLTTSAVRLVSRLKMRWNEAVKSRKVRARKQQVTLNEFLIANRDPPRRQNSRLNLFNDLEQEESPAIEDASIATKKEMKFTFAAPTISLQIGNDVGFESSPTQSTCSLIPLLNLSIRGIRGDFESYRTDEGTTSQFSARLRSIHASDMQKAGSHFYHFLSSVDPGLLQDDVSEMANDIGNVDSEDEDLVVVQTSKSPQGDQETSIHFHELYVEWNPELLALVQKSLRLPTPQVSLGSEMDISSQKSTDSEFFDAIDTTDSYKDNENNEKANPVQIAEDKVDLSQSPVTMPKFKVLFHLSKLRINFNKDSQNRCLFSTEMNQTDISFCRKPLGGSKTNATVASLRLKDPDGMTGGTLYGEMIGIQSGGFGASADQKSSIVKMSFETCMGTKDDDPEFHNLMRVDFSEMKFVYMHQLWLEIFDYFFEGKCYESFRRSAIVTIVTIVTNCINGSFLLFIAGILGHAVWGTKPKPSAHYFNIADATRAFKRTKMFINMEQPLLLLPVSYRSPHHLRLKLNALKVANHFNREQIKKKEGSFTEWNQWFNNCKMEMCGLDVRSWDERKLNEVSTDTPPSLVLDIRWPIGPTAPLIKPKWNVDGRIDPLVLCLSRKDFSLFRFFVGYNLLEISRFLSKRTSVSQNQVVDKNLVLFGYEKTGVPPTTYSIKLSCKSLEFRFILDEEESNKRKVEGMMNVNCSNASWSLVKNTDCISRQRANLESICLTQTSNRKEWAGFPDLLLPLPSKSDATLTHQHYLLQFTSTTYPSSGNNVKTLHLDAAGIFLIIPAWQHVGNFFKHLPTLPEEFAAEEMSSIMQVGDRFYRMSKSSSQDRKTTTDMPSIAATLPPQAQKQFLLTLTSPRIILVADASDQPNEKIPCVTLSMAHLNLLRETNVKNEVQSERSSVFCDGLEVFTGLTKQNLSTGSSLLCPLSFSGSLSKTIRSKNSPHYQSGWVWAEELQARAAYTDLTHSLDVLYGVKQQMKNAKNMSREEKPITQNIRDKPKAYEKAASQNKINFQALCDGFSLVVTDDSHRHFANAQPLVAVSLTGMRFSRIISEPKGGPPSNASLTQNLQLVKSTFVSLDSLELTDLIRQSDSPFRVMATSSRADHSKHGLFSFTSQVELDAMSWDTHKMDVASSWGFQMSASLKKRHTAIHHLSSPATYFDKPSGQREHLLAFHSVVDENGRHCIDFNHQHLTAQWNPSTIIALQRFLGRLKKAARSIFIPSPSKKRAPNAGQMTALPDKPEHSSRVIFSVNVEVESICICLNKEYQQRRLLDLLVTGIKAQFDQNGDKSLLLQGSIDKLRAWDPDMSKVTSDRNRHLLDLSEEPGKKNISNPFFSFHYMTFKGPTETKSEGSVSVPEWVASKISSGDIDDFLSVKMRPLEFNYLSERTAELADYLNNGLPGKGMGATSKAAQTFCERRIRTRSFLDLVIDQPRVFIPRSAASVVGGCFLSLGTVAITSWFEEASASSMNYSTGSTDANSLVGLSFSSDDDTTKTADEMDWWRVLDVSLGIGVKIEVNQPIRGMTNPDTFFSTSLTMRKPTVGKTTIICGNAPSLNIHLKYREFMMLNLIAAENVGARIDSSKWDNIEKSYWQSENDTLLGDAPSKDQHEPNLVYADSARFVRFGGEARNTSSGSQMNIGFSVESINITLHRDDWLENLDQENAALLCYDICKFSIHNAFVEIAKRSNGDKTTSISLVDMSFTDLGDYGRLARELYMGSADSKRPPCAFSVVAQGYGESSADPLVSLVLSTHTSSPDGDNAIGGRARVEKNVELKINSLSITVLPRSIDDVISFLSKKWSCVNSNLDMASPLPSPTTFKSSEKGATTSPTDTVRFKFVAVYPRLILLADETDPFSRALVLRGLAVGNMNRTREEASLVSQYGQVDTRSTTTVSGHMKELSSYVHNNIDTMIGPNHTESGVDSMGVALIEPVTITLEVRVESRTRFPTSRFFSVEVEPVATLVSFGDLLLLQTIIRKQSRRKKTNNEKGQLRYNERREPTSPHFLQDSVQLNSSSGYSECDEGPLLFDVVILTKKLGLKLRKSGSSVVVESSLNNPEVKAGDTLLSINGQSIERLPLPAIVEMFDRTPRPLNITFSRLKKTATPGRKVLHHQPSLITGDTVIPSNSLSFELFESPTSEQGRRMSADDNGGVRAKQEGYSPQVYRIDLKCKRGKPNGLELLIGLGGAAVVDNIDYGVLASCIHSDSNQSDSETISSMLATKQLPLPGSILLAVDGDEMVGKDLTLDDVSKRLESQESSLADGELYTLSFVEADSSTWGNVSNLEGKLSVTLTLIDDANGRDLPILRVGVKNTSFIVNHGLATSTKTISTQRPLLLNFDQSKAIESAAVLTVESEISTLSLEYNNARINQWEPIIEPHCLIATIERQSGSGSQPGQCAIIISDQISMVDRSPMDFICVNVADSAVDIMSKAAINWKQFKTSKSQPPANPTSPPGTPKLAASPIFGGARTTSSTSSAADLKKATKLAKMALDFSRKRGKVGHTGTADSPFVLRNYSGLNISLSSRGVATTVVRQGHEAQFQMNPIGSHVTDIDGSQRSFRQNENRLRKYDGHFPTVDIELELGGIEGEFDIVDEACKDVFADPITNLPTDKVGETVRCVKLWKKDSYTLLSQQINVIWSVQLEENRRVLTVSSATAVKAFGCGPVVDVGVRLCRTEGESNDQIIPIGNTSRNNTFHLPLWVESTFCQTEVFVRPSTQSGTKDTDTSIYKWSTFPILSLKEECWNADATEVHYCWVTDTTTQTLGGVSCPLNVSQDSSFHPKWLQCTTSSKDLSERKKLDQSTSSLSNPSTVESASLTTTVTIWSAITIRNMLPCSVEWEVSSHTKQNESTSVFDGSSKRSEQRRVEMGDSKSKSSSLQCGGAVEVFAADALEREIHARFKCNVGSGYSWSEWLNVGLGGVGLMRTKQVNVECKNDSSGSPLAIGVKLSPRLNDGKGVNLMLYAEVWLRNLTTLPLSFGVPWAQLGSVADDESKLPGKISADSALIELSSVLEGNGFTLFGNDEDDEDVCDDISNLPLQQCNEVFEEVFEYVSLNEKGGVDRRWYASENHINLKQEPKDDDGWHIDCAGQPYLQNGWESCSTLAGSRSVTFNGRRPFNRKHRYRRRRWFRKIKTSDGIAALEPSLGDKVIFHQPADLDQFTRSKREAERNAIGVHLDEKNEDNLSLLDVFNRPPQEGVLDIMTRVANDGSILIHVKHEDGKWSTPAIIPPSGSSNGVIRVSSSRWPLVTKAIKQHKQKPGKAAWEITAEDSCEAGKNLGLAPLDPSVFELIYQVTMLSGLWGELSRMVTITPRFLLRNESSWLDIDVKQVGAPDTSRMLLKRGEMKPLYWCDNSLPELVCARPTQSRNRLRWSGGFDLCTLGMVPIRVRRVDGSIDQLNITSMRVNVELQPGTGGSGTIVSIRDEDPRGEGSLFRIENHSPFPIFLSQDGVLANPASALHGSEASLSCDVIKSGEHTSYALDVPFRQGKYAGRSCASMHELLMLRVALAPLATRDGVETTKMICFARVGDYIRLSPSKLSTTIGTFMANELLGLRVFAIVGTDGPTRTLRFILMKKEVTASSYIGSAMRETISPMPSFMSVESAPLKNDGIDPVAKATLDAANMASKMSLDSIPNEKEAANQAFFGTGICERSAMDYPEKIHPIWQENNIGAGDEYSFNLSCSGLIFSIIDSSPTELAVLSLHDVKVGASWNSLEKEYARSRMAVGWLQLDNQCPNSVYPVAIRPRLKAYKGDSGRVRKAFTADKPFLELKVDFAPRHRTGIQSLSAGVSLHDTEIFLDLAFIVRLQRWITGIQEHVMDVTGNRVSGFVDSIETWDLPNIEHLIKQKTKKVTSGGQSMYNFQRLTILPCKIKLSVAPVRALTKHQEEFEGIEASAIHAAVRKGDLLVGEGVLGVKIGSKNTTGMQVIQGMLKSILVDALLRCDGASLNFEGVALFNHTSNRPQLLTYLGAHYLASLISNVPSLIGSLAAFGNPLGLIRDLGDGVSDFVNEPVKGFKRSIEHMDPSFVMSGVARGTGSLARHTVGGFADSAAMLTETAAKNMAVLTLDRKYAQRRDRVMKLKANDAKTANILRGLESGIQKLVNGVMEGVTGVVSKPIRGAERSGFEGFAKGVGKGLLGLLVKPVIGTTDLITDTLIGVKGSVEGINAQEMLTVYSQVRPRRALYGRDRVVKPYQIDDATAATIQSKLCIGGEEYFSHVDMLKSVALISVSKLMVLSSDGEELLLLSLDKIQNVSVQPRADTDCFAVAISLTEAKSDGSSVAEVLCEDEKMANKLHEKLIEALSKLVQ